MKAIIKKYITINLKIIFFFKKIQKNTNAVKFFNFFDNFFIKTCNIMVIILLFSYIKLYIVYNYSICQVFTCN